jgi:hypothetical protein
MPIAISNGEAPEEGEHMEGAGAARRSMAACSAASRAPLCTPTAISSSMARVHRRSSAVGGMLLGAPAAIADTAVSNSPVSSGAVSMRRSTCCITALMSDGGQGEYLHAQYLLTYNSAWCERAAAGWRTRAGWPRGTRARGGVAPRDGALRRGADVHGATHEHRSEGRLRWQVQPQQRIHNLELDCARLSRHDTLPQRGHDLVLRAQSM